MNRIVITENEFEMKNNVTKTKVTRIAKKKNVVNLYTKSDKLQITKDIPCESGKNTGSETTCMFMNHYTNVYKIRVTRFRFDHECSAGENKTNLESAANYRQADNDPTRPSTVLKHIVIKRSNNMKRLKYNKNKSITKLKL